VEQKKDLFLSPCHKNMQTETIPELPNILSTYTPKEPVSRIHEQKDIDEFLKTKAFDRIMTFVMLLNQSVLKKKISDPCIISPVKMSK
jgi:serine/threonine-protein phosphatase 2A activator